MRNNIRLVLFLTTLCTLIFPISTFAELVVEDGYVRKPIPGRSMSAAFMTINNNGNADVILKTAALEGAKKVEIHTHNHQDGVMRMRQLHELRIKAGDSVVLEPGGLHLMVFGISTLSETPQLTLCDTLDHCTNFSMAVRKLVQ